MKHLLIVTLGLLSIMATANAAKCPRNAKLADLDFKNHVVSLKFKKALVIPAHQYASFVGERDIAFSVREAVPYDRVRKEEVILTEAWSHSFTTESDAEFDQIVIGVDGPKDMTVETLEKLTNHLVSVQCN